MSRCFPFPPPGYVLKENRDEAMIVPIKGADEKAKKEQRRKERKKDEKGKKERKERKKDKMDKKERKHKKDKKRKERDVKEGEGEGEKHSHKRQRKEESAKSDPSRKRKESEFNCLEKSSLTVELELRQSTSQTSCDSTLNSNEILPKQKEEKQPLDGRHNNSNCSESIVRIQLPVTRQNDPEVMMSNKDQVTPCTSRGIKLDSSQVATKKPPCTSQGIMLGSSQLATKKPLCTSAGIKLDSSQLAAKNPPCTSQGIMLGSSQLATKKPLCTSAGIKLDSSQLATKKPVNQHPCSTSAPEQASKPQEEKKKDPIFRGKHGKEKRSSSSTRNQLPRSKCSCSPSMVLQFLNVVENWVPDTMEKRVDLINSEDEECWWSKQKKSSTTDRCRELNINNEMKQVSNSMGWPCARLLPEADIYALPYTVPF